MATTDYIDYLATTGADWERELYLDARESTTAALAMLELEASAGDVPLPEEGWAPHYDLPDLLSTTEELHAARDILHAIALHSQPAARLEIFAGDLSDAVHVVISIPRTPPGVALERLYTLGWDHPNAIRTSIRLATPRLVIEGWGGGPGMELVQQSAPGAGPVTITLTAQDNTPIMRAYL